MNPVMAGMFLLALCSMCFVAFSVITVSHHILCQYNKPKEVRNYHDSPRNLHCLPTHPSAFPLTVIYYTLKILQYI